MKSTYSASRTLPGFLDPAKKGLRYPNLRCKSSLHLQFKLTVSTNFHHCHITPTLISSTSSISINILSQSYHHHSVHIYRHIILTITKNASYCSSNCYQHHTSILPYCCTYTSYQSVHHKHCCPISISFFFTSTTATTHFPIFFVHQHLLFNTAKSSRSA